MSRPRSSRADEHDPGRLGRGHARPWFDGLTVAAIAGVAAFAVWSVAGAEPSVAEPQTIESAGDGDPARGRRLYVSGCASCHGDDGRGVPTRGPSLEDAGAASAHFYLTSGRMPASVGTGQQAERKPPAYSPPEIDDLVAYVATLGEGPPIPDVRVEEGDLAAGQQIYTANCASCHNSAGSGGALGQGFYAPSVTRATNLQVAEAVRVGPGAMPSFGPGVVSDQELASITRYVDHLRSPDDRGGASLGRIGPVTEGLVAWLVGMTLLVGAAWLIGARR